MSIHMFMNDDDMNALLAEVRPEGEEYRAAAFGTIRAGVLKTLAFGALSNAYCYLAVTGRSLVVVETGPDNDRVNQKFIIPFDSIHSLKLSNGLLLYGIKVENDECRLHIMLNKKKGVQKVAGQKEAAQKIMDALRAVEEA